MITDEEYIRLAERYVGMDHSSLSKKEQLTRIVHRIPYDTAMKTALTEGARKLNEDEAGRIAFHIMTAFDTQQDEKIKELTKELSDLLRDYKKD